MPHQSLAAFTTPVAEWFESAFAAPTPAQIEGWKSIAEGNHTLIAAPTGSGKTLAAFLWGIDRVMTEPVPEKDQRTRVLYLSPLRALANDVDKNLRSPLEGIAEVAERHSLEAHMPTVGVRTGDTSPAERRRLVTRPPDILITTPESLYLMLTSRAREALRAVRWVIVDEIHSVAATKRGSHLAVSLERLCLLTDKEPQRIALSATQRPLSEVAEFLGGWQPTSDIGVVEADSKPGIDTDEAGTDTEPSTPEPDNARRQVEIIDVGDTKHLDIEVIVPDRDMGNLADTGEADTAKESENASNANSIWPSIHPRLLDLILSHHSTIIFVNARRLAERLASRLNELYEHGINRAAESDGIDSSDTDLVRAHHGSLSREQRLEIEDALKSGELRAIVSTSSLELGIDMGAVDLVIQVESPGSVSSGMQRIGRAGHQVGQLSVGKIFPSHRNDLIETAVVVQRMRAGLIEHIQYPRLALDVLAQHIVAMSAVDDWNTDELLSVLRRAAPYHRLSQSVFESVLDLLSGRYPSQEFSELRPRIVWDRIAGTIRPRQGAGRLAVTNGGTIADRGLYPVFTLDGSRVGELDEEMVYEARAGESFLLGASSWRIEEITHDRVLVSPAPGVPAKMPFWHGGGPGRPLELGRAVGAFMRETVDALPPVLSPELKLALRDELYSPTDVAPGTEVNVPAIGAGAAQLEPLLTRLQDNHGLNRAAAVNVLLYLDEQRSSTGAIPDDRTVVVERFRDELGDWRICILTPFGSQVHAPWAIAMQSLLERDGADGLGGLGPVSKSVDILWNDDGIVLRLPDTEPEEPGQSDLDPVALVSLDPDTITDTIIDYLPSTALFASRFREVAGRALLLPRRKPGQRTPLWQQRQRAGSLLEVAAKYPSFPMLLETTRECLQDVFNVPALVEVLRDISTRKIRVAAVDSHGASPMAQGLMFDWTSVYMYSGDMPLAERRAAALSLNQELLTDLLGPEELRELLDPEVLDSLAVELERIRAHDADQLHDELRRLGDLSAAEIATRWTAVAGKDAAGSVATGAATNSATINSATSNSAATKSAAVTDWLSELVDSRRACEVRVAGENRFIATEDAASYHAALDCLLPAGLPASLIAPDPTADGIGVADAELADIGTASTELADIGTASTELAGIRVAGTATASPDVSKNRHLAELVARFASTHGPFSSDEPALRLGVPTSRISEALTLLEDEKRVVAGSFRPGGTQSEWCDAEVLRTLRRRSLARLRRAIRPVTPSIYGRFLPVWHGLDRPRSGEGALVDAINMLSGTPLVASTLESDVLPARVRDYKPADIDALLSSGELIWIGAGPLGSRNGRVRLYWRSDFALLAPDLVELPSEDSASKDSTSENITSKESPGETNSAVKTDLAPASVDIHDALRQVLLTRGSAFWPELLEAVTNQAGLPADVSRSQVADLVLSALWDLVWAGEVTNDTLMALRAVLAGQGQVQAGRRGSVARSHARANSRHARRGPSFVGPSVPRQRMRLSNRDLGTAAVSSVSSTSPPAASGRWSGTAALYLPRPAATERAHYNSLALLDRHGIVTRSGVLAEQQPGGFASVYAVLRALEERGGVRRGYFIDGLGGAQFASPEAVELLRSLPTTPSAMSSTTPSTGSSAVPPAMSSTTSATTGAASSASGAALVLASTDPAQPYGAALPWPASDGRPTRRAGSLVVLAAGVPLVQLDRGGHGLQTFESSRDVRWVEALRQRIRAGATRSVELAKIDGQRAASHPLHDWLIDNGFKSSYRGPTLRS